MHQVLRCGPLILNGTSPAKFHRLAIQMAWRALDQTRLNSSALARFHQNQAVVHAASQLVQSASGSLTWTRRIEQEPGGVAASGAMPVDPGPEVAELSLDQIAQNS